jgi:hypothetical protein
MYTVFVKVQLAEDKLCFYCSGTMISVKRLEARIKRQRITSI